MNQLCKVCGEPAAGFHFGAFTCEGCKSFFGRTYNNFFLFHSISECKNNGECVINKKNRTACKACRLRKCLVVGMSKSGSRYGRRSNWFKIHCLLTEQQNKVNNNSSSNNNNNNVIQNGNSNPVTTNNSGNNASLLQNDFISSHFLANLYKHYNNNNNNNGVLKVQEAIKRVSSPSDSGASSADLDETSVKFNNNNITKSKNLNQQPPQSLQKPRSNSFSSEKQEKANSSPSDGYVSPINTNIIKPATISPFLPFTLSHHHNLTTSSRVPSTQELFMLSLPQISLTPSPQQQQHHKRHQYKRKRTNSDNNIDNEKSIRSTTPEHIHEAAAAATKTVPLDLTLVRSG
ncbi:hypothetical protein PVAND_001392 [Polypedilum vanderplanki]|uniref:Nuclear receptor domain-containing protein n=1 Tax=Polypedilum vanderplanki TaxID=319348 RepID=A0A9J6BNA2_POLVA|nr:hypothetical protein PVAND_001392 [Polypedilum vanderplanki]